MRRTELEHAIRVATEIVRQKSVYVIGSQAILGSFHEDQLPPEAFMSREVDIAPVEDDEAETLATRIDVIAGEESEFDAVNGFYIQGVGRRTAKLPPGWAERLVRVHPPASPASTGLCLEPYDLCAAKLAAMREKDTVYVDALIRAGLIDPAVLLTRIQTFESVELDDEISGGGSERKNRMLRWVEGYRPEREEADTETTTR